MPWCNNSSPLPWRYIETSYQNASQYGPVPYNFTAPGTHCRPSQYFVNTTTYPNLNQGIHEYASFVKANKEMTIWNGTSNSAELARRDGSTLAAVGALEQDFNAEEPTGCKSYVRRFNFGLTKCFTAISSHRQEWE